MSRNSQWWIPTLTLWALPAFAAARDDDQDDSNNSPNLSDAVDVVQEVADHAGSPHDSPGHVPTAAAEAQSERLVVHGGMSWVELARTHQQARALGTGVSFGEATGHAPNPFQVDPALRGQARCGQAATFGESGAGLREGQWAGRSAQWGEQGGANLARGAQYGESLGGGRVALNVAEEASFASGTFGVARVAEEGLLLKIGAGAVGLGGLAASRRRRQD